MHRQLHIRLTTARVPLRHCWKVVATLAMIAAMGITLLPLSSGGRINAAEAAPGKPSFVTGVPGNQQISLTWGAVSGATGYFIDQTDLVTGQTQRLSAVSGTSISLNGLSSGRWYRFRVIPTDGATEGTPSDSIEVRTTGLQQYDHYYALGDSYSAGDGAPPYTGAANCYRSMNSYPYLLGSDVPTPTMIACTSATTKNIDQSVQFSNLPGTQLAELQSYIPKNSLVTLTIGGNDVGFADEFTNCVTSFFSCTRQKDAISQRITALKPRLVQVYREIRQAAPAADIVVLGYPLLVADPASASCHNPILKVGLSKSEMSMIRQLADQLDTVIAQAATEAGVASVTKEVEQAFAGHETCTANESDEWINEVAGLNVALKASFHPNSAGYRAYASALNIGRYALYQAGMVRYA